MLLYFCQKQSFVETKNLAFSKKIFGIERIYNEFHTFESPYNWIDTKQVHFYVMYPFIIFIK